MWINTLGRPVLTSEAMQQNVFKMSLSITNCSSEKHINAPTLNSFSLIRVSLHYDHFYFA